MFQHFLLGINIALLAVVKQIGHVDYVHDGADEMKSEAERVPFKFYQIFQALCSKHLDFIAVSTQRCYINIEVLHLVLFLTSPWIFLVRDVLAE